MNLNESLSHISPKLKAEPWFKSIIDLLQEQSRVIQEQTRIITYSIQELEIILKDIIYEHVGKNTAKRRDLTGC